MRFLANHRFALLADEMGLGKSAQVIKAVDSLKLNRILILCPGVARVNWQREVSQWSDREWDYWLIFGRDQKNWQMIDSEPQDAPLAVICSYDLVEALDPNIYWDLIVLDESHYLKSSKAKRSQAVLGSKGLVHKAKRIWAISGTPATNHPGELWTLFRTFGKTDLSYENFVEKYCTYYEFNRKKVVTGAKEKTIPALKTILNTFMLRRLKEDVMPELPPISYKNVTVQPGEVDIEVNFTQYLVPKDTTKELFKKIAEEEELVKRLINQTKFTVEGMKVLEALAESVSTLRRYNGLQKVEEVAKMIYGELKAGAYAKVVVFAIHQGVIEGLRVALEKFRPVTLYGGTPAAKRQKNIDLFMKNPGTRVFIGNIKACGVAIDLTSAHHVVMVEQEWSPGANAQAIMRCHRITQKSAVFIRNISLANSLDEKLAQVLLTKSMQLTRLFDDRGKDDELILPEFKTLH